MNTTGARWPTTAAEARTVQEALRGQVVLHDDYTEPRFVAGTDVGFKDSGRITRAAVTVLSFPALELVEYAIAEEPTRFPYVPGYLSFREVPAILAALNKLKQRPDLLLCDGQGIAHPRRFGLACHLGVLTNIPSIGVAKSRLVGEHEEPGAERGARAELIHQGELIGAVLRTRDKVKPLYISTGHRISLDSACELVLRCLTRYRLPETTRWADRLASQR